MADTTMAYSNILVDVQGGVAVITIDMTP